MQTENDDVLQGRRQWPLCGLPALRPQLQGWPCRPFGGEQVPPGFSDSSPAPGVLWQRGCKFPLQTPVCSEGLVYPPQAGARTSSKMPPCCRHGPISDPTQLPKDCPSVCLSAHPVSRCRAIALQLPEPRVGCSLLAPTAGAQDMLGHRTCWGSSAVPGTAAQPQKQEAVSASFLPTQENHRLTWPGRKRGGGRKCSRVTGFRMKPSWK